MKECIILFLRRTKELDKPVGTIEVIDNLIVQARGYDNWDLPADAKKFLTKWDAKVLKNTARQALILTFSWWGASTRRTAPDCLSVRSRRYARTRRRVS